MDGSALCTSSRCPASYALRGRAGVAKSAVSSAAVSRPSAGRAGRAFLMTRSGSAPPSSSSSSASALLALLVPGCGVLRAATVGSTERWTTRDWERRSCWAGRRGAPTRRE